MSEIAKNLKDTYNIITYTYTARKDLNFDNIEFIVNGSNCPQDILLPNTSSAGDGWNVKIQNPGAYLGASLTVYDFTSNVLFTINYAQMYSVVTDGSTWYFTYSYEF